MTYISQSSNFAGYLEYLMYKLNIQLNLNSSNTYCLCTMANYVPTTKGGGGGGGGNIVFGTDPVCVWVSAKLLVRSVT